MKKLIVFCLSWTLAAPLWAAHWKVDHADSRLVFTATWEGNEFEGVFPAFEADIVFDADNPAAGRFDVRVDVTQADAGNEDLNEGMAAEEWLDYADHPKATFVTSTIRATGEGRYEAEGTLTIKGISQSVTLPFTWKQSGDSAQMDGEVTLQRTNFNVGEGEWASGDSIGLDVQVAVDLELQKQAP